MTEPFVPAECDLRGMPFMPLHCQRLLDSDLFAISTGDEFKAAVALWCKSWFQVPAGSLPNDERVLEHLSSSKSWKKVRGMAMRGWTLCSDNRYYHSLIVEYVLEAWERREDFREVKTNKETRQQRWREKLKHLSGLLRAAGVTPPMNPSLKDLLSLCETHIPDFVDTDVDAQASTVRRPVDKTETAKTGDSGQGTGDSKKTEDIARRHPDLSAGEVCKAIRAAGVSDANPSSPKLVKLIEAGITLGEFVSAAEAAVSKQAGFAYTLTTAENRRRDAAKVGALPPATRGRPVATEPEWRREQRERVQQAAPYAAARREPQSNPEVLDALPPASL